MKVDRKGMVLWLLCGVCALVLLTGGEGMKLLSLPFILLGKGLRLLSMSGGIGNVLAWGVFGLVCLCPLALKGKRKWERGDGWLVLAAGMMVPVLYLMVNPNLRPFIMRNEVGELVYAGAVYSLVLAWGVGRLLKTMDSVGVSGIYRALRIFLMVCAVELAAKGVIVGAVELAADIRSLGERNTIPGMDLTMTYVLQTLRYGASALEYGLDAAVMWYGAKLLKQVELNPYSEECVLAGAVLQQKCSMTLGVVVGLTALINTAQVLCAQWLYDVDVTLYIPVFSMGLVFVTLAVTRLLGQGKAIKDDNDLFV